MLTWPLSVILRRHARSVRRVRRCQGARVRPRRVSVVTASRSRQAGRPASVRHNDEVIPPDEHEVIRRLRRAGARFAFVHGSRTVDEAGHPDSDLDVAAWWGEHSPQTWDVDMPGETDLVVLDRAPLWLAGRVALYGRLLFDDDQPARIRWQADTRRIWLDERPALLERQREWREAVARGR